MPSATPSPIWGAIVLLAATAAAQSVTSAPASITAAPASLVTAVTGCHFYGSEANCKAGTNEYQVVGPTRTEELEAQYTGCHVHEGNLECLSSKGEEVIVIVHAEKHTNEHDEHAEEDHEDHDHDEEGHEDHDHTAGATEQHCHFHAGVEHCETASGEAIQQTCERTDRDYNIPLRVGLLFAILAIGAIGVFMPILATSFTRLTKESIIFVILKQFGTGVVISTAFIHLFTHANLFFSNPCLGELAYESTTAAVFTAGLFLSFLVDYLSARFINWRQSRRAVTTDTEALPKSEVNESTTTVSGTTTPVNEVPHSHGHGHAHTHSHTHTHAHGPNDTSSDSDGHSTHDVHAHASSPASVLALEAGIIFHSLLIGLTLVVAGDSFFKTLFAVIVFHQFFEGMALGTCIASLSTSSATLAKKLWLATAFAFITPLGMAIGIGVLKRFNGNDPQTIVAIGTLDAVSAGILAWVGLVEMLAKDWLHGALERAGPLRVGIAMVALVAGLVVMSALGKWT